MKTPRTRVTAGEVQMMLDEKLNKLRSEVVTTLDEYTEKVVLPAMEITMRARYVPFYLRIYYWIKDRYQVWKIKRGSSAVVTGSPLSAQAT